MEEQVRATKSSKRFKVLALVIVAWVACAALLGLFFMKEKTPVSSVESDSVVEVKDEATLRELLLEDSELVLSLTEDIVDLEEGFVVNGTKTLQGSSMIQMKLSAIGGQSVFSVSSGATFVMDGITIDGNGVSDGIYVNYDAELEVLDGDIIWTAANAIKTNGCVTIQDIDIDHSMHTAIQVADAGEVYMKGGNVRDSGYSHAYIAKNAYLNVTGDSTFDECIAHGIQIDGTVEVKGGIFSNSGWYAFANYGTLKMESDGSGDGCIKIAGTGTGGVYNATSATTELANVEIYDTKKSAFKSVGGTSTVTDCRFERTGSSALQLVGCEVKVENVEVIDANGCGLYAENKANIEVQNFTVENCSARGVMSSGATITGDTITIKKPGSYGISNSKTDTAAGVVTVSNVSITDSQGTGINANGADLIAKNIEILNTNKIAVHCGGGATITLENATVKGIKDKQEAIHVKEDSTVQMKGDSLVTGVAVRAVGVKGTFIMDGGVICDNNVTYNGAAVYVYKTGSFVMNGGTIRDNSTTGTGAGVQVKKDGKVTINGGKICNNTSVGNGAGINADTGAIVYLKSGSITGNKSAGAGDGVCASGEVTLGKNFYMGSDEIKIGNIGVTLKIEGNQLSKHSEKEPLRVTPVLSSPAGTQVVECKTEADAIALSKVVGSGDGSFALVQDKQYFKVDFTTADMDMTGADTVYVSDFEALKTAVEGTTGKRYIVIQSDIQMESRVRVPGGATIYIKDDGTARTLSRAEGNGAAFFETSYGTGLYLVGTQDGNLILNGTASASVATSSMKPLVVAKGSTVIQGVKMTNNGTLADGVKMQGAFVQQLYADITITDSEFANGKANAGGAVLLQNAKANIENCTFTNNESVKGGGAIRVVKDANLEILNSVFVSNEAGTDGGAINSNGAEKLVVTDCSFTGNESGTLGGAINVTGDGSVAFITGTTGSDSAIFADNVAKTHGGALHVTGGAKLIVEGYEFVNNSTETHHGGAIFVNEKSNGIVKNSTFYENSAASAGGAIATTAGNVNIVSCEFGEEGRGNTAGTNGGAVYVTGNGTIAMTVAAEDGLYNSLNYNSASESGGAIFVNSGVVTVDGYQLNHNNAVKTGGALYVALEHSAEVKNSTFTGNTSTSSSGGAATVYGTLSVSDTVFNENTATTNGGAIACYVGTVTGENVIFNGNAAKDAGAVYLGKKANATFSADKESSSFTENKAANQGGAILVTEKSNLSIDGYSFVGNESVGHGGAVMVNAASTTATIKNTIFKENKTGASGGAVATNAGRTDIISCQFGEEGKGNIAGKNGGAVYVTGKGKIEMTVAAEGGLYDSLNYNSASESGGAIFVNSGVATVDGYQLNHNSAVKTGGALYVAAGHSAKVKNSVFTSNASTSSSGGAATVYGTLSVSDTTFTKNTATTNGGAIACYVGSVTGSDVVFAENAAKDAGAVYLGEKASATFTKADGTAEFRGNVASNQGGAILAKEGAELTVDGYSFSKNSSTSHGGAVMINEATTTATISNSIFTENTANNSGGAVATNSGTVNITSTNFDKNSAMNGGAVYQTGDGAKIVLTVENGKSGSFTNNYAMAGDNRRGGAIRVNGGEMILSGYTFENNSVEQTHNNCSTGKGNAIYVAANKELQISDCVFTNNGDAYLETGAKAYISGNLQDIIFVYQSNGENVVIGNDNSKKLDKDSKVSIQPVYHEDDKVLGNPGSAYDIVKVLNDDADQEWFIDAAGKLQRNLVVFDMTAPTVEGQTSSYLQGGCTDGTYFYQAFVYGDDATTVVCKYDKEGVCVKQSDALDLGHGSDITYNSKLNQLVVCHYSGSSATVNISFLDTENLAVQSTKKINYNAYAISYNALRDSYVIGYQDNEVVKFAILDSEFNMQSSYDFNTATTAMTKQGAESDDAYIYFLYYNNGSDEISYEGHVVSVYDWEGDYVGIMEISKDDIPLSCEPENISKIGSETYISCITGNGKATIYKLDNLEIKYEAKIGDVYYRTLEEAVIAAHADTENETVEITVLSDVVLSARQDIKRNIILKNLSGKDVVISGDFVSPQLIRVWKENNVTCKLEISGTEDGSITIDGTGRTTGASLIRNDAGCTFTLGTNAAIINGSATSTNGAGAALNNYGIANLSGDFTENDATNGGAIYNQSTGVVNIYAGTYSGNTAKASGGAIYNLGQMNITGGTFSSNQAATYGGAIYSEGTLKATNAKFNSNYTTVNQGGAIYHKDGQIQVDGCTFDGNYTTKAHGGAMYVKGVTTSESAQSYIQNSFFYQNSAKATNTSGGAIAFEGTTLSITNCQFGGTDEEGNSLGNTAGRRAGAIYQTGGGTITITSNTKQHVFANNTCGEAFGTNAGGGALYSNSGTINITGYIFENNKAAGVNNDTSVTDNAGTITVSEIPVYEAKVGSVYYSTLEGAVTAAHVDTESETVEITVLSNVVLSAKQDIKRDIILKNLSGKDVVISGDFVSPQLIRVWNENNVTCKLEISGTEDGSIAIDGTGRTTGASLIRNDAGCTFTLGTNAAIKNGGATSGGKGAALDNYGTANLYGDFIGNDAENGGAIYNQSTGVVNIYGGSYSGNTSTIKTDGAYGGGAIYSVGTLKIKNAKFTDNNAYNRGGAIYHTTGQLQVEQCTFNGNYTQKRQGGAMYVANVETSDSASSYIMNTSFYKNTASTLGGSAGTGGAIAFENVTLNITDCQFGGTDESNNSLGNTADRRGGAIYQTSGGTITIMSTTGEHSFENNVASGYENASGGALYSNNGTITVNGYIFKNNTADGVGNNTSTTSGSGNVELTDCTEK